MQRTPRKTALAAQARSGVSGKPKIGRSRARAADFLVPAAGLEPARCCHRGILSPLRLPVSPRRHAPSHRTTAANTCQAQETRTAAARTLPDLFDKSARQLPIPDTRLLHPAIKFDKIINYFYRYRFWIRGTLHL